MLSLRNTSYQGYRVSKKSVEDLIDQKVGKMRSIRSKNSNATTTMDYVLEFLDSIDQLRKNFRSIPAYKAAIVSKLFILEARIKSYDYGARVNIDFNDDKGMLEAVVITWTDRYLVNHPDLPKTERFCVEDILLKELGLL